MGLQFQNNELFIQRQGFTEESLESQFLEKPFVLAALVSFFQGRFDRGLNLSLSSRILERFLIDNTFVDSNINRVSCWHKVVVVYDLHKGLDFRSFGQLLLAHGLGDLSWVSLDACHQSVSVHPFLGTIILLFDDDSLSTSVTAGKDNDHLSRFHKLDHGLFFRRLGSVRQSKSDSKMG